MSFKSIPLSVRIAFSFALLAVNVIWVGMFTGLLPSTQTIDLETRSKVAEIVAVQVARDLVSDDAERSRSLLDQIADRTPQISSLGIVLAAGEPFAASGDHDLAAFQPDQTDNLNLVLSDGSEVWGELQMAFVPFANTDWIRGVPNSHLILTFSAFSVLSMIFYVFMRRLLVEVRPDKVVPARVQAAYDTMSEGVAIVDRSGAILLSNQALCSLIGRAPDDLLSVPLESVGFTAQDGGQMPWQAAMETGRTLHSVRLTITDAIGESHALMVNASRIEDVSSQATGALITFDDVSELERTNDSLGRALSKLEASKTEILKRNKELEYIATHDALSKCLNRRAYFARFEDVLEKACANGTALGCIMVDLDHFKSVNDRFGHGVGDRVIQGVAAVLREFAEGKHFAGRYGGEEFGAVFVDMTEAECMDMANRIRLRITEASPEWFPTEEYSTASIGVAIRMDTYDEDACTTLVDWADQALYAAKKTGRNKVVSYHAMPDPSEIDETPEQRGAPPPHAQVGQKAKDGGPQATFSDEEKSLLDDYLKEALLNDDLDLHYQPVMCIRTNRLVAFEALLRLRKGDLGDLSMGDLIKRAEETGFIHELGQWTLTKAMEQITNWKRQFGTSPDISLNISALQFALPYSAQALVEAVEGRLDIAGNLQIEVTHTSTITDFSLALKTAARLKAAGVVLGVDDFGSDHTSMQCIAGLEPDFIKFDRTLTHEIQTLPKGRLVLERLVHMAKDLDCKVSVTGIEDHAQLATMAEIGCDMGQGYLISRPLPENDAAELWARMGPGQQQQTASAAAG